MKFLLFNVGSETIKYAFYEDKMLIEKKIIYTKKLNIIGKILNKYSPDYILHRVVHGGNIKKECFIDKNTIREIEKFSEFAPLHNPKQLEVIKLCQKQGNSKNIAIFDTSFFSNIPEKAKIYPIPLNLTKKYNIQRYGFHGLSHEYNSMKFPDKKIISCHLGSGCSICAINHGKAVDISMGLTPLEGTMMVTRSGSIDPGIILMLASKFGINEADKILNYKSGFVGLTGLEDVKKISESSKAKDKLAIEIFCYNLAKQICAYQAALRKIDVIVFSGGIGESNKLIRDKILVQIPFKAKIEIIRTNEEELMLEKASQLIKCK